MKIVNVNEKFSLFSDYWNPRIVGEVNDSAIKLAKLKGEFIWHHHDDEDELFLVVKGKLIIEIENEESVNLHENEFIIIPKGISHRPIAKEEVHVMLIEPTSTINTGNVIEDNRKREKLEKI